MNKKKLINLLQAINFGDMILSVKTAEDECVGADNFRLLSIIQSRCLFGKNMHRIVWEMGHLPERMKSYGKDR